MRLSPKTKKLAGAVFLFFVVACAPTPSKELSRISAPEGKVDAVIATKETGATILAPTLIYIVPTGKKIYRANPIFVADKVENISISWDTPQKMVISFSSARIFTFSNFWQSSDIDSFNYIIQIYLNDQNAP